MAPPQFNMTVQHEFNDLILGNLIGSGSYRDVYEYKPNSKFVVKVEMSTARQFENVAEWAVWHEIKDTMWAKYFAPCVSISHSGSVLIQERTEPIKRMPKQLPNFMADLKRKNFGRIGNRIVAHDYGHHLLYLRGMKNAKLIDVKDDDW